MGEIFLRQVSEKNPSLRRQLTSETAHKAPGAADALAFFRINAGPWDRLAGNAPFIGTQPKPPGAAFYPAEHDEGGVRGLGRRPSRRTRPPSRDSSR